MNKGGNIRFPKREGDVSPIPNTGILILEYHLRRVNLRNTRQGNQIRAIMEINLGLSKGRSIILEGSTEVINQAPNMENLKITPQTAPAIVKPDLRTAVFRRIA